jgi:hypothetical protein
MITYNPVWTSPIEVAQSYTSGRFWAILLGIAIG